MCCICNAPKVCITFNTEQADVELQEQLLLESSNSYCTSSVVHNKGIVGSLNQCEQIHNTK